MRARGRAPGAVPSLCGNRPPGHQPPDHERHDAIGAGSGPASVAMAKPQVPCGPADWQSEAPAQPTVQVRTPASSTSHRVNRGRGRRRVDDLPATCPSDSTRPSGMLASPWRSGSATRRASPTWAQRLGNRLGCSLGGEAFGIHPHVVAQGRGVEATRCKQGLQFVRIGQLGMALPIVVGNPRGERCQAAMHFAVVNPAATVDNRVVQRMQQRCRHRRLGAEGEDERPPFPSGLSKGGQPDGLSDAL